MKNTLAAALGLLAAASPALAHDMTIRPDCTGVTYSWWGFPEGSYFEHAVTADGAAVLSGTVPIAGDGSVRINYPTPLYGRRSVAVRAEFFSDIRDTRRRDMALACPAEPTPPVAPEPPVTPPPSVPVTPPPAPPVDVPELPKPPAPPKKLVCQELILKRVGEKWLRAAGCKSVRIVTCPAGKQRVVKGGRIVCVPKRRISVTG